MFLLFQHLVTKHCHGKNVFSGHRLTAKAQIRLFCFLHIFILYLLYFKCVCECPFCSLFYVTLGMKGEPASVAQLDAPSDWRLGGLGFNPRRSRQHSFVEIDHEIFSTVILSLPLIQEGQLSVSGKRMCTILVNRLED